MDEFCGSKFWDSNLTWNTNNPDLTPCFESTVLKWIPSAFLWIFALIDVHYSSRSIERNVPISPVNITKTLLTLLLIVVEILQIGLAIIHAEPYYSPEIISPILRILTYALFLLLLVISLKCGVQSSGVQFLFWFIALVCQILIFQSAFRDRIETRDELLINFTLVFMIAQFILHCWADVRPREIFENKEARNPCPERNSSFLCRLIFYWFEPVIWKGIKKPLQNADVFDLNPEDTSRYLVPIFDKYYNQELRKCQMNSKKGKKTQISIVKVLFGALGATYIYGAFLKFIPDLLSLVSPQILGLLIDYANGEGEDWKGYLYAVLLFAIPFISTLFMAQFSHRMYLTAIRLKTGLVSLIYRKALRMSSLTKKESTVGEIVNLMSVDVQRLMEACHFVGVIYGLPIIICITLYFLWGILGPSSLAGLGTVFILIPANIIIANKIKKLQIQQMMYKDERVKLINEILNGIKVLKLYAWEVSFQEQISAIRRKEIRNLKKAGIWNGILNSFWQITPFLITFCTFTVYVLIDEENVLDSKTVFTAIAFFNVTTGILNWVPTILVSIIQAGVSIKRINKFINSEELNPNNISHDQNEVDPIVIEKAFLTWGVSTESATLRNINLRVKQGQLIGIVGTVGSGKSSMLSGMLGELERISGRVNTKGTIGYVSQQAWIQNATVRDNILFGKEFDLWKYNKVISSCALKPDLEILPARDRTEIGEKGINLSGGQKARVSLARAVYSDSDMYLLDDPLSAVDSHVGKHLFEEVIGPKGLLKDKTRVLVTHGVTYLSQMDLIVVMKDGEISESGTFKELMDKEAEFAEFLNHHLNQKEEDVEGIDQNANDSKRLSEAIEIDRRESMRSNKLIKIEESETKSVKMGVYLEYLKAASLKYTIPLFGFYFVFQGFSLAASIWLSEWSNEDLLPDGTLEESVRNRYLGVYAGLGVIQAISIFAGSIALAFGTIRSSEVLHEKMLKRILQAPMSFFDTTPLGRIVNRFSRDIEIADNILPPNIRWCINAFFQILGIIVVISYSTPIFLAVIVPISAAYYGVQYLYVSTSRQLKRIESVSRSPIYSHFGETITGASTIRAFGMQETFIKDSERKVDFNQTSHFSSMISNRWLQMRLEIIGNSVVFFSALFVVLGRDSLSSGLVGLSVSYALQITMALIILVRWTSETESNIVCVERIIEYSGVVQEAPRVVEGKKPEDSWPEEGAITFEGYQTRYREELDLVLKGISCDIKPGEKVGVVGRTGAGKSSLTLALFRIIESTDGAIFIDGKDIGKLGLHDVRGRLTIIPQDPVLFYGTLRMNLDPFNKYSDDIVWQALEMAHLKSFVKELPSGLEHDIAEGGENLSVGQRQLVCLARALLRKSKILILDEATAAIDLDTDDLIQQTIRSEFKDSTVITIAHRLNTIMDSNRVLVLDNGEIREFENPQTLLQNSDSIFYSMAKDAGLVN